MNNYTDIPNWIIDDPNLTHTALTLACYLIYYENNSKGKLKRADVLNRLGCSKNTYSNARNLLIQLNILIDETPNSQYISYYINPDIYKGKTYGEKKCKVDAKTATDKEWNYDPRSTMMGMG